MNQHTIVALMHVLFAGPLLVLIGLGITGPVPRWAIAVLGGVILLYHAMKAYLKMAVGASAWVNLIHVFVVGPLLIAEGALTTPPRYVRELILMSGIAAIGYHGLTVLRAVSS
jgi:hypothetical protein